MMEEKVLNKELLDKYLKDLAKEYKRQSKERIEIILVGGASIVAQYGFRETTTDIDAVCQLPGALKDAIKKVRDKYDLSYEWFNTDVMRTSSYSVSLRKYSKHYRTYSNVVEFRTISAEYLVAMKLRSGRQYKHDMSDILGILESHEKSGKPIALQQIENAVINLYGSWDEIHDYCRKFIYDAYNMGNLKTAYSSVAEKEEQSKDILLEFQEDYPNVTNENNVNDILYLLRKKSKGK